MSEEPQVVITGLGVVSPIGVGIDPFWASLREGRSGVSLFPLVQDTPIPVKIGAAVTDFEPKQHVKPRKSLKVMCREVQMGFAAAAMAIDHAGIDSNAVYATRYGVVFGAESAYGPPEEWVDVYQRIMQEGVLQRERFAETANREMYPLWMLKFLPNMVGSHVGIANDARGPSNTIAHDNVSSLLAAAESVRIIQRGHADVMVCGGVGSRLDLTHLQYRVSTNLSHRHDNPSAASRPFDADRDGIVNGEGGGALVLERREHAEARGAQILATVLGCGNGFEARLNGAIATGSGIENSIRLALREADLTPADIGHVNAHGVSTIEDDAFEAKAIHNALGEVPVTAPKSYFGHLGVGSGAVELVASVLGLQHDEVPHTLNYETPDPACPVRILQDKPLTGATPTAISLSQNGPGQAAALLIGRV